MLHIDIPTLAEFPGQLTSKMDERDNACGTANSPSTAANCSGRLMPVEATEPVSQKRDEAIARDGNAAQQE